MNLISGNVYKDESKSYTNGEEVVFKWTSVGDRDPKDLKAPKKIWAIVHPIGEPDMQSCYGLRPDELSGPIRKATREDRGL